MMGRVKINLATSMEYIVVPVRHSPYCARFSLNGYIFHVCFLTAFPEHSQQFDKCEF